MRSAIRFSLIMSTSERALDVLRVAAGVQHALRAEVGRALELGDALGDLVRVPLLLVRMLQELRGHGLRVNARGHEVVPPVAQDTHDLGRQGLRCRRRRIDVELGPLIALGHGAALDVLAGARAQRRHVGEELVGHGVTPVRRSGDPG